MSDDIRRCDRADHGISPTVEAAREHCRQLGAAYDEVSADVRRLYGRLDAALRRIDQLEQKQARNDLVYRVPAIPIDPEHERIVDEAIRNARPSAPIDKEDV